MEESIKPLLRGHFHQAAFFTALGACVMLLLKTQSTLSMVACSVYSVTLVGLLGVSALYHRKNWTEKPRLLMRRIDHSAIYVFMGGSATPLCLLALEYDNGIKLLALMWGLAITGLTRSIFWPKAPKWVAAGFYMLAGWMALPYLPDFIESLGTSKAYTILFGGVLYTIGGMIYALKKPNPFPKYFGYHEIFHILVIVGAAIHFGVITLIV